MQERIAIYPGTFDPMTIGHADILSKSLKIVDQLIIGVAIVNSKNTVFSVEDRVKMAQEYILAAFPEYISRIRVMAFNGLLVNFAKEMNAGIIIRGLRAVNDFEYEFQLSCVNSRLMPDLQTVFIPASENNQYISSRFVKEVARLGGDISSFSCNFIVSKLMEYYSSQNPPEQHLLND